ncbi:hypothetical protein PR048_025863 [Dryococelus australis]|uniref:Glycoside hydrolase family 38 central domain-containing protein n=1 Tax=Dryococelus australis TaxID=614101 RepID=A0ABQ9GJQ1_9NEOP|nr:hypothetical protein PR048_025863 [Dryococelus australis]
MELLFGSCLLRLHEVPALSPVWSVLNYKFTFMATVASNKRRVISDGITINGFFTLPCSPAPVQRPGYFSSLGENKVYKITLKEQCAVFVCAQFNYILHENHSLLDITDTPGFSLRLNDSLGPCGVPRVGWQIDSFGHSRETASIMALMGFDGTVINRIDYQDKSARQRTHDMEFMWRASSNLDGSAELFTTALFDHYHPPPLCCWDVLCSDPDISENTASVVRWRLFLLRNTSSMEQHRNERAGEKGDPRENPPTSGIIRHDSRMRKSGSNPNGNRARFASLGGLASFMDYVKEQAQYFSTNNVMATMGNDFTYMDAKRYYHNIDKLIDNGMARLQPGFNPFRPTLICGFKSRPTTIVISNGGKICPPKAPKKSFIRDALFLRSLLLASSNRRRALVTESRLLERPLVNSRDEGVHAVYSTPDCYVKAVHDASPVLSTHSEDFFPYASSRDVYWTGYYTSRPTIKYLERLGSNFLQCYCNARFISPTTEHNTYSLLFVTTKLVLCQLKYSTQQNICYLQQREACVRQVCKQLCALSGLRSGSLDILRETLGVFQHHDAITGTERRRVADDYVRQLLSAVNTSSTLAQTNINRLLGGRGSSGEVTMTSCLLLNISQCEMSERSQDLVVTVYNPLSRPVSHYVRLPVPAARYIVSDMQGQYVLLTRILRMERRWNLRAGETGVPRENPPASGIVQDDSHMRKSGSEPAGDRTWIALEGGDSPSHCTTAAPSVGRSERSGDCEERASRSAVRSESDRLGRITYPGKARGMRYVTGKQSLRECSFQETCGPKSARRPTASSGTTPTSGSGPTGNRTRFALMGGDRSSHCATAYYECMQACYKIPLTIYFKNNHFNHKMSAVGVSGVARTKRMVVSGNTEANTTGMAIVEHTDTGGSLQSCPHILAYDMCCDVLLGAEQASQLVLVPEPVRKLEARQSQATCELVFRAVDLPPLGLRAYRVRRSGHSPLPSPVHTNVIGNHVSTFKLGSAMIEVSMEQLRNERAGVAGDPRENPPTSRIIRHDSHTQKSGDPVGLRRTATNMDTGLVSSRCCCRQMVRVEVNASSGLVSRLVTSLGVEMPLQQNIMYYSSRGGAYVFKPDRGPTPVADLAARYTVYTGNIAPHRTRVCCAWCARLGGVCEIACGVRDCVWCARWRVVCEIARGVRDCAWCARLRVVCEIACSVRDCVWCTRLRVLCEIACGMRGCEWCARLCVVCEVACGVRDCVFCARLRVVYEIACSVRDCVWCTRLRVLCEIACGMRGCEWCARLCVVCEVVWCVRDCVFCARLRVVCEVVRGVRGCAWCARLRVVYEVVWCVRDCVWCARLRVLCEIACGVRSCAWCARLCVVCEVVRGVRGCVVCAGELVDEVHQVFDDWASQVVRVYKEEDHVEFEWLVGPIPIHLRRLPTWKYFTFDARKCGSDKDYIVTYTKCAMAAMRKALDRRAVLSSCCLYLNPIYGVIHLRDRVTGNRLLYHFELMGICMPVWPETCRITPPKRTPVVRKFGYFQLMGICMPVWPETCTITPPKRTPVLAITTARVRNYTHLRAQQIAYHKDGRNHISCCGNIFSPVDAAISTIASHQGEPGSIPGRVTGFSQVGGFSRESPISPPLKSGASPYSPQSPSLAPNTAMLRGVGTDVISLFSTELRSRGEFRTDSNGREVMRRKRGQRADKRVRVTQPVAGNYYPVTAGVSLRDDDSGLQIAVLTDRAQGASSVRDGQLELMVSSLPLLLLPGYSFLPPRANEASRSLRKSNHRDNSSSWSVLSHYFYFLDTPSFHLALTKLHQVSGNQTTGTTRRLREVMASAFSKPNTTGITEDSFERNISVLPPPGYMTLAILNPPESSRALSSRRRRAGHLTETSGHCRHEHGLTQEWKDEEIRRSPRKPVDQCRRRARFPHAKVRERPHRESNPARLDGRMCGRGSRCVCVGVLQLHRRLLRDDNMGLGESLDDRQPARGRHYVLAGRLHGTRPSLEAKQRLLAQSKLLQPWIFLSPYLAHSSSLRAHEVHTYSDILPSFTALESTPDSTTEAVTVFLKVELFLMTYLLQKKDDNFSGLRTSLPDNVQLLTLEPWGKDSLLVRLEHILEKDEDELLSRNVTVNLKVSCTHSQSHYTPHTLLQIMTSRELIIGSIKLGPGALLPDETARFPGSSSMPTSSSLRLSAVTGSAYPQLFCASETSKYPMRVIEVRMELRRNDGPEETGDPRENPPTSGIVQHDSHLRKSGVNRPRIEAGSPWWEASVLTAQPPRPQTHLNMTLSGIPLDSTVLCTLESQMFVHWLLHKRVASVTPHRAVLHSLLVSLQVCYWLRVVLGVSNGLLFSCKVSFDRHINKVMKPIAMLSLHKAEEYTACIQVDLKQGFQKCSFYREQPIKGSEVLLNINANFARLYQFQVDKFGKLTLVSEDSFVKWSSAGMKGWRKQEIPEKTRRPPASSGTIPTCENPEVARPGIEPGPKELQKNTVPPFLAKEGPEGWEMGAPRGNRHDSHMRKSGVTQPGIESGSPRWEASRLTAQPQWPLSDCGVYSIDRTAGAPGGAVRQRDDARRQPVAVRRSSAGLAHGRRLDGGRTPRVLRQQSVSYLRRLPRAHADQDLHPASPLPARSRGLTGRHCLRAVREDTHVHCSVRDDKLPLNERGPSTEDREGYNTASRIVPKRYCVISKRLNGRKIANNNWQLSIQDHDGNTARLARRGDEALGVRVSVARIAPSLIHLGRGVSKTHIDNKDIHKPYHQDQLTIPTQTTKTTKNIHNPYHQDQLTISTHTTKTTKTIHRPYHQDQLDIPTHTTKITKNIHKPYHQDQLAIPTHTTKTTKKIHKPYHQDQLAIPTHTTKTTKNIHKPYHQDQLAIPTNTTKTTKNIHNPYHQDQLAISTHNQDHQDHSQAIISRPAGHTNTQDQDHQEHSQALPPRPAGHTNTHNQDHQEHSQALPP